MPYRIDIPNGDHRTFDRLIELGALDAEAVIDAGVSALMPDSVAPQQIARALGLDDIVTSPAVPRDAGSVWVLRSRPMQIGRLRIVPADSAEPARPGDVHLIEAAAFGTGLHPTTALCLESLQEIVGTSPPASLLDVGTGSGILALAALTLGVPRAVGVDVDDDALRTADENARRNGLADRLVLLRGGPDIVTGNWPLIVANVLAAPLIELAPALVQRLGSGGQLVLSGIPSSVEADVRQAYHRLGMRRGRTASRGGWVALVMQTSW